MVPKGQYESVFTNEQEDLLILEIYKYVENYTYATTDPTAMARDIIEMRDDEGALIFYDSRLAGKDNIVNFETLKKRIQRIRDGWKKQLAPHMRGYLVEGLYAQAKNAKNSPASLKAAMEVIDPPKVESDETKPALPPRVAAILQQNPVGTTIIIGEGARASGEGDAGHECVDTVHPVAAGQQTESDRQQDTTFETLPSGHDTVVYGVHEGGDTSQGYPVSDTEMASEDTVDNDSRGDLDASE